MAGEWRHLAGVCAAGRLSGGINGASEAPEKETGQIRALGEVILVCALLQKYAGLQVLDQSRQTSAAHDCREIDVGGLLTRSPPHLVYE